MTKDFLPPPTNTLARPRTARLGRWLLAGALAPVAATALWGLAAFGLAAWPLHPDFQPPPAGAPGVDIFVLGNGVHTDVALPYVSRWHDFRPELPLADTRTPGLPLGPDALVAIGWGSRGFYLETPTWAQLKASTAFKALFWLDRSAMHVTFLPAPPPLGPEARRVRVSPAQYARLVAFVAHQFAPPDGTPATDGAVDDGSHLRPVRIPGAAYDGHDAFYEARGTYSLFNTCNTWTARALSAAGVTVGAWTPLETNLLHSLPPSAAGH